MNGARDQQTVDLKHWSSPSQGLPPTIPSKLTDCALPDRNENSHPELLKSAADLTQHAKDSPHQKSTELRTPNGRIV